MEKHQEPFFGWFHVDSFCFRGMRGSVPFFTDCCFLLVWHNNAPLMSTVLFFTVSHNGSISNLGARHPFGLLNFLEAI